jgi:hypothetical protein
MKRLAWVLVCGMGLLVTGAQGWIDLTLTDDTYVDDASTSSSYGGEDFLRIQGTSGGIFSNGSVQRTFLKFTLNDIIPSDAVITDAVFGIFYAGQNDGGFTTSDPSAYLYYVSDDDWDEDTLNWNDSELLNASSDSVTGNSKSFSAVGVEQEWDLFSGSGFNWTNWQDDLEDGFISLQLAIELDSINNYAQFYSGQNDDESLHPYLKVEYYVVPEPAGILLFMAGIGYLTRKKNAGR